MRQLHIQIDMPTSNGSLAPFNEYAEIKNGEVRISNGIHAIRFPQDEVFGKKLFTHHDIWYFKLSDWKAAKAWRAKDIDFNEDKEWLTIKDSTSVFTTIKLIDQFDLGFVFPNISKIWPERATELPGFKGWGLNAFELFSIQRMLIPGEDYDALKLDKVRIRCMEKDRYIISYCGGTLKARALLMGWSFNSDAD